jgi:hypothetical protein
MRPLIRERIVGISGQVEFQMLPIHTLGGARPHEIRFGEGGLGLLGSTRQRELDRVPLAHLSSRRLLLRQPTILADILRDGGLRRTKVRTVRS